MRTRGGAVLILPVIIMSTGIVGAAGTTGVSVSPATADVTAGEKTTTDIVLESADDGVGSIDIRVDTNNSVATVTNATVADDPEMVSVQNQSGGLRIAANGMDTNDTGPVVVATVTVKALRKGTSTIDVTTTSIGDESGESYELNGTSDGRLVVSQDDSESGSDGSDGEGGSDGGESSGTDRPDEGDSTPTPTETSMETPTRTPTVGPTSTSSPTTVTTATPTAGRSTPTSTAEPTSERAGANLTAIIGGLVVVLVIASGGIIYYRRS